MSGLPKEENLHFNHVVDKNRLNKNNKNSAKSKKEKKKENNKSK
jgi:hypothetical protein